MACYGGRNLKADTFVSMIAPIAMEDHYHLSYLLPPIDDDLIRLSDLLLPGVWPYYRRAADEVDPPDQNTFRILVTTDNHVGYMVSPP